MTKPIRPLPVAISVGVAAVVAMLGYAFVDRLPARDPLFGALKSRLQTDLLDEEEVVGTYPESATTRSLATWSGYTGNLQNEVLYYIFVDRFYDGDSSNNLPQVNAAVDGAPSTARLEQKLSDISHDPSHRLFGLYFGGDLAGVRQKLPYLAHLGVTKIVLSPVQEGAPGFRVRKGANMYLDNGDGSTDKTGRSNLLANYHGYWIRDWFRLDPRMRSDANPDSLSSLTSLLDEAAKYKIGVILDLTLHHTSLVANRATLEPGSSLLNVFPALGEVRERGKTLANVKTRPDWYQRACQMDYGRPTVQMLTRCQIDTGLPTLNHENPIVTDYLLRAARFWMSINPGGAQVAGIRIDAIKHIDAKFVRRLVDQTRRINPKAIIFAEDFGGGSQSGTTYDILDAVGNVSTLDFSFTDSIRYFFSGDRSWTGHRTNLESASLGDIRSQDISRIVPNWFANPAGVLVGAQNSTPLFPVNYPASKSWLTSLEAHDAPRLRTFRHQMSDSQYAAMIAFHFVARGIPLINYGAEIGLSVPPLPRNVGLNGLGGDPFNRQMMIWPGDQGFNHFLFETTRTFIQLRRENPVLRYGDTLFLRPTSDSWFARPVLMLRWNKGVAPPSTGAKGFLYAFSPEGGAFEFELPITKYPLTHLCDVQFGDCLRKNSQGRYSVLLRQNVHRVFKIT